MNKYTKVGKITIEGLPFKNLFIKVYKLVNYLTVDL